MLPDLPAALTWSVLKHSNQNDSVIISPIMSLLDSVFHLHRWKSTFCRRPAGLEMIGPTVCPTPLWPLHTCTSPILAFMPRSSHTPHMLCRNFALPAPWAWKALSQTSIWLTSFKSLLQCQFPSEPILNMLLTPVCVPSLIYSPAFSSCCCLYFCSCSLLTSAIHIRYIGFISDDN